MMDEPREILERTFLTDRDDATNALAQAVAWIENNDVDVDTVIGDLEYAAVYYTENKAPVEPEMTGPEREILIDVYPWLPDYTLKGRTA